MSTAIKENIQEAILAFASGNLTKNALSLFSHLGYNTDRQASFTKPSYGEFRSAYVEGNTKFKDEKALVKEWEYVDCLFQLSKGEVTQQNSLFDTKRVDDKDIQSYLFFVIELSGNIYSRTILAQITREVNKLFPMPVMILFKIGNNLTLSVINRRLHKRDESKDVLEKVTVIKDISIEKPHRAHIEILFDLSFGELLSRYKFTNFVELHNAWHKTLDIKELNKRFYQDLFNWYLWACRVVKFPKPAGDETDDSTHISTSVIRMLTRMIFCWFIKEGKLVPEKLFDPISLKAVLKNFDPLSDSKSDYYNAILQNLFFATFNTEMPKDVEGSRKFHQKHDWSDKYSEGYMDHLLYRNEEYFSNSKEALNAFADIPFLNGGLFECLDTRDYKTGKEMRYDGFSSKPAKRPSVPNILFFAENKDVDLSKDFDGDKKMTHVNAQGLIQIFNNFKFTIEENTPLEQEIALDPELLGKVFENLLAAYNPETKTTARKKTGSFYTPREIVNYMVDESLIAYLVTTLAGRKTTEGISASDRLHGITDRLVFDEKEKVAVELNLRMLFDFSKDENPFAKDEDRTDKIIYLLSNCRILDPACGSGAFPMGILQKMVFVLRKLDPNNKKWKLAQKKKAERDLELAKSMQDEEIRGKAIEGAELRIRYINESFDKHIDEFDYLRKLFLIENCIYGVDIQNIAVQISKLRFFISLMVNQKADVAKTNMGILSLPNLETKFVAANTLIQLQKEKEYLELPEVKKIEEELRETRKSIFFTRKYSEKKKLKKKECETRERLKEGLKRSGFANEVAQKVADWNPFDPVHYASFFDRETMFGFEDGFDIVIGNPPYVQIQNFSGMQEQKDWEKQKFETYTKTGDVYCLFYERGFNLLKTNGVLAFITSNKWMRANYGKVLRKFFAENANPVKIVDFDNYSVFDATVNTNIIMIAKAKNANSLQAVSIKEDFKETTDIADYLKTNGVLLKDLGEDSWLISSNEEYAVKKRIEEMGVPLKDWDISIYRGILTGLNEAFIIDGKKKDELIAKDPKSAEIIKPILLGKDIKRYRTEYEDLWLINTHNGYTDKSGNEVQSIVVKKNYPAIWEYLNKINKELGGKAEDRCDQGDHWTNLRNCAYVGEFDKPKIAWGNLAISSQFAFVESGFFINAPSPLITPGNKYLLAVLNSKIGDYYIRSLGVTRSGGYFEYKPMFVENLPVPKIPADQQLPFEILVDCILFCKSRPQNDMDSSSTLLESVIDGLVYDLYFPEEMKTAHCYITDRLSSVLKPFKKNDTIAFKTEYIKTLEKFINKDETISHSLVHRHLVKPVQIILGDKK